MHNNNGDSHGLVILTQGKTDIQTTYKKAHSAQFANLVWARVRVPLVTYICCFPSLPGARMYERYCRSTPDASPAALKAKIVQCIIHVRRVGIGNRARPCQSVRKSLA
jgi:hypothetical protein